MAKIIVMKNISLFIIIDNLFKFILLFTFNLIWCSYFFKPFLLSCLISFFATTLFLFIINLFNKKKKNKKQSSLKEEQRMQDIKNTFMFLSTAEVVDFYYNLAQTKHKCLKFAKYIKVVSCPMPIILYPFYKATPLLDDDFLQIFKQLKGQKIKKLIIVTNTYNANSVLNFDLGFDVLVLDYKQTYYNLLKEYEFYPEIIIKNKNKLKNNFKQILCLSLNKKKTKGYFISALLIFFASFFVSFKIYYLIFSNFLMFLALFSWFNPTFNKINKSTIFE